MKNRQSLLVLLLLPLVAVLTLAVGVVWFFSIQAGEASIERLLRALSAYGAYDTKACHGAIAQRGAQVIIPPRKNAKIWKDKSAGAQVRNQAVEACKRLGSRIWKKWSGYHRRSLVETKMDCFKRRGERVMAKTFER